MTVIAPAPSPFESFNARALEPKQVAKTFIPPGQFDQLVLRAHNLVIGPRGSGKTTLLKMLQGPALETWRHESAESYRQRIDFTGVFISSDITWSAQLKALVARGFEPDHAELFVVAAFSTSVFKSLTEALAYRCVAADGDEIRYRPLEVPSDVESALARELVDALAVDLRVPSLMGVRAALGARLNRLQQIASSEQTRGSDGRAERLADTPELHTGFLPGVSAYLDRVEMVVPHAAGERWALLFDELELAPRAVRDTLLSSLRSVDDRLLFKLSVSPYNEDLAVLESALSAMPGHDYEEVVLTYGRKEEAYEFCERLFVSLVDDRLQTPGIAEQILGRSEFETEAEEWRDLGTAYRPNSRLGRRLKRLAEADKSFRAYLAKNRIQVDNLEQVGSGERAAEVRKITSLAAVRLAFRTTDGEFERTKKRIRAGRAPQVYAGASSLFAMVEGNPRWLIAVSLRMLAEQTEAGVVRPAVQVREVSRAVARFRALLRTIPVEAGPTGTQRGLLSVVDRVGEYIFRDVVVDNFTPDPVGTFTVDSHAPPWLLDTIGRALNAGAFIYVPDRAGEMLLSSLRGKRFRLSYLFSPHYRIPIRLGRAVSISHILQHSGIAQRDLFDQEDPPK